ncbi:uncharacterized protein I303_106534 [Kwoniella dejecticola CBS 10117]|uniref:Uncharacterized protein n=1 Tax=Kwoniella dejecticola CBS 10117 TaxID=1296121 RepID=A0A1A5ZUF7_9TREE|nr:uncharacterized protein I303_08208 [Kwoniella dejecticola CBS 10117]OBR81438.1 hypothetical protein I303_08208 [Kwoniella dejecticola CBS 10117]
MPSQNNQTWSPRHSEDFIRRPSGDPTFHLRDDYEDVPNNTSMAGGTGRRRSLIKVVDFNTWGRKTKVPLGLPRTQTQSQSRPADRLEVKTNHESRLRGFTVVNKLRIKRRSKAFTKRNEDGDAGATAINTNVSRNDAALGGVNPLKRVWARTGSGASASAQADADADLKMEEETEKAADIVERRGSDWPPTQWRELNLPLSLDLSCIPTFTGEHIEITRLKENFDNYQIGGDKNQNQDQACDRSDRSIRSRSEETLPIKGGTNPSLDEFTGSKSSGRVDTPLEMPLMPQLNLRKSHSSILSPVLDTEEEREPELGTVDEDKGTAEPTNTPARSARIPRQERCDDSRRTSKDEHHVEDDKHDDDENDDGKEEFFTPTYRPSSVLLKSSFPSKFDTLSRVGKGQRGNDIPQFDLTIFSPRPRSMILPQAPVLRGLSLSLIDHSLPISPLELPSTTATTTTSSSISFSSLPPPPSTTTSSSEVITNTEELETSSWPTPLLSKDPPNSPHIPILMPIPRRGARPGTRTPNQSIESVLNPQRIVTVGRHKSLTDRRPSRPSSGRNSSITLDNAISKSNSISHTLTHTQTQDIPPTTRRRMSLIIKPAILPCPTPPSLITSPKSLGTEYIPPLFSPSSISPTSQTYFSSSVSSSSLSNASISGLPIRRGRGSLKMKLPQSYFRPSQDSNSASVLSSEEEAKEHVPTPGTFGLEGERGRWDTGNVNPYFA